MKQIYIVSKIEELDYGCEGIPDGESRKVTLTLESSDGTTKKLSYSDDELLKKQIEEGDEVSLEQNSINKEEI